MENQEKNVSNLCSYSTYAIVLKEKGSDDEFINIVEDIFTIKTRNLQDYMCRLLNDVSSPYYNDYKNKFLAEICTIDGEDALVDHVNVVPRILCSLDEYIRINLRRYQQTIQVLNYTPHGYYKKSEAERKEIQERLDNAIVEYVSKYVAPDISEKVSSQQIKSIKDILNNANSVKSDVN